MKTEYEFAMDMAEAIKAKGDEYYNSITENMSDFRKIELTARSAGFDEAALMIAMIVGKSDE